MRPSVGRYQFVEAPMVLSDLLTAAIRPEPGIKPRDDELDLFGVTHPGKVRSENQDHFLVCTVHQQVVIHGTSLPDSERLPLRGERLATMMLVADGVGGAKGARCESARSRDDHALRVVDDAVLPLRGPARGTRVLGRVAGGSARGARSRARRGGRAHRK